MNTNPVLMLQRLAARYVLGLARSWDLPPAADRALDCGIYSPSLAELAATTNPIMSDAGPLFERAMNELGHPVPSHPQAAWIAARECVERIAEGAGPTCDMLVPLRRLSEAVQHVLPDERILGGGLDIGLLLSISYSYDEPNENFYEPENRRITTESERRAILDREARAAAAEWLLRNRERGVV